MTSEPHRTRRIHLAVILGTFAILAVHFWFVCDDAYISFRYARNWALGYGLVFNPGEAPPVEGYSNLLWVVLCAAFERVGLAPAGVVPWISAASGGVLLWRVHVVLRDRLSLAPLPSLLAALTLAASPALGVWATSGLATMPQALLTFLLAEAWLFDDDETRQRDWAVPLVLGAALCLLRTEGVGWVVLVAAVSVLPVWGTPRQGPHLRALARAVGPVVGLWLAYTGWRFWFYGTVRPHIALTKVSFGARSLGRGLQYVTLFWLTCVTPLVSILAGIPLARRRSRLWLAVLLLAVAWPVYAVVVGGDFMPFARLLVPGLPFGALLLGGFLHEAGSRASDPRWVTAGALGLVVVQAAPIVDVHLVPERVRRVVHFRLSDKIFLSEANRWANQRENTEGFIQRGIALAQVAEPTDTVVAAAVGAVGYYSGLEILDQHGLVTREVGLRPMPRGPLTRSPGHDKHVEPTYFVKYEPRFLYARAVQGKLAAGRMKDTLEQWSVSRSVMDRYVPDYYEVALPGEDKRTFLFVVRRRTEAEDPAKLWQAFPGRRRALNAELRAEYEGLDDELDADPG